MTSGSVLPENCLAPPRRATLLRQHDFRSLWIGETTSAVGTTVSAVALPLVALTVLHTSVVVVGVISAATWLPWLLIGLPAGAWVDRLARRPVMIACDVASFAAFASVPVAAWCGVLTLAHLVVAALVAGTAKVFFVTAFRAYLPALVDEDELVEGNARLQGAESAAEVVGPGLGGVLAQGFGAADALLADAVSFVVSIVCLRRIRTVERRPEVTRKPLRHEIAEGLRFVARDRLLSMLIAFGGLSNLALIGFEAVAVAFLVRGVGLSSGWAGLLLAVGGIGGVLGAALAPRLSRAFGSARMLLITKLVAPPCALLIPLTGDGARLAFFVVGSFGAIAGIVAGNVISGGFMPAYVPRELLGRVTTSMQLVNYGTMPIGAVVGGALAGALGFRDALWLLFAGFAAVSTILLFSPLRGRRDLPTRAERLS